MDAKNPYHTNSTYLLMRIEHSIIVIVCSVLVIMNDINWARFIIAFFLIDLIGYIPGAIVYRRRKEGHTTISPIYHHLYNITHSYLTAIVIVAIWAFMIGGFEWAMLAFCIHLSGDRGLFGIVYKPVALPFEPATVPMSQVNHHHEKESG